MVIEKTGGVGEYDLSYIGAAPRVIRQYALLAAFGDDGFAAVGYLAVVGGANGGTTNSGFGMTDIPEKEFH